MDTEKCEYKNCSNPATRVFVGTRYCNKDFHFVKEQFYPFNAGRKPAVHLEKVDDFIKSLDQVAISTKQIAQEFEITYPTAQRILAELEKLRIIKFDENGVWLVRKKAMELQKI